MTTITFDRAAPSIEISGHAGSAPAGQDLICAACTILSYTLINAASVHIGYNAEVYINDLDTVIQVKCNPEEEMRSQCEYMFDVVLEGFLVLSDKYPDHVKVIGA